MNAYAMTSEQITAYGANLRMEERCEATVQKYISAVTALFRFLPPEKTVTRELLLAWKAKISVSGVNAMISVIILTSDEICRLLLRRAHVKWDSGCKMVNITIHEYSYFSVFMSWRDIRSAVKVAKRSIQKL